MHEQVVEQFVILGEHELRSLQVTDIIDSVMSSSIVFMPNMML